MQACTLLEEQYAAVSQAQIDALLRQLRGLTSLTTPLNWWPTDRDGAIGDLRELRLRSASVTHQLAAQLAPVLQRLRLLHLWNCHRGSDKASPGLRQRASDDEVDVDAVFVVAQ